MSNHSAKSKWMGAWLASTLIAIAYAAPASHADEASATGDPSGFASIVIEGASKDATFQVDGHTLNLPIQPDKARPFVIKSGHRVIEVREGERVALREEVTLKPGETRTLRVPKAE